jgi:hypothetical protein
MTLYDVFWVCWVVAGIVVELVAVFGRTPGATLSEHVKSWLRVGRPVRYPLARFGLWVVRAGVFLGLLVLAPHFAIGVP